MFGKRLESLRKDAGLSQAELGRQLGEKYGEEFCLSQTVISAYEKGIREPSNVLVYVKVADFFGVTTDFLLGADDKKNTSLLDEVQRQLSTLSEDTLQELLNYVLYLKQRDRN